VPWHIEHQKGSDRPWKIIKTSTGEVVGSSTDEQTAKRAIAARYASESGVKMRNKK